MIAAAAWRRRLAPLLASAAMLGGCASTPPPPYQPQPLTAEQRRETFDQVWNTIDQHYIDPRFNGADWRAVGDRYRPELLGAADDPAFWSGLNRMVGELRDAHTQVRSPMQANATPAQRGYRGVWFMRQGEHLVVKGVSGNSQAALLGVRAGQRVQSVDGQPALAWWAAALQRVRGSSTERSAAILAQREVTEAPVGTDLALRLQRNDGSVFDVALRQDPMQALGVRSHLLASGLGYLQFAGFIPTFERDLHAALDRLGAARGVVIDLRGNGGGTFKLAMTLLGRLLDQPGSVGEVITRDNRRLTALLGLIDLTPSLEVKPGDKRLTAPLAVLINEDSASAAELMTAVLQQRGRARVFGAVSCGCLLATRASGHALPGGGRLQFSEVDMRIGGSTRVEGVGVQPDEPVPFDPAAMQAGQDATLDAALAWLGRQTSP